MSNGFVFYDGPSLIDGAPIVGIAILRSRNGKTGDMVQTFILRADVSPLEALRTGADASICGDCGHRPTIDQDGTFHKGTCYVDVGKSVMAIWSAWVRGAYPLLSPRKAARLLRGRRVRMGAYGDPAAIPAAHWNDLIRLADGHTGYSHQWRQAFAQPLRGLVMASVDTPVEHTLALSLGWRTFRVRTQAQPLHALEFACPASPEGGNRRQCVNCLACDGAGIRGTAQASVAIVVHGAMARRFQEA